MQILSRLRGWLDLTRNVDFLAPAALRLYLAPVFILAGMNKLGNAENVAAYFEFLGVPAPGLMVYVAGLSELVGGILLILGVSLAFTNFLVDSEVPQRLFEWIRTFIESKFTFLILLNIILLALGAILDIFSALVIMIPLIVPMALQFGVDPVHLGIIFLANMQIGYFTPPIGMNLFIASYRFKRPITELYRATIPFMFVLLLAPIPKNSNSSFNGE